MSWNISRWIVEFNGYSDLWKQTRNLIKLRHTVSGGAKLPKQINYYFLVFTLAIQMAHSHCYICVCVRPEGHAFFIPEAWLPPAVCDSESSTYAYHLDSGTTYTHHRAIFPSVSVRNSSFKPSSFETLNLRYFKNLCPSSFSRRGCSSNSYGYRAKCHKSDGMKQCSRSPVLCVWIGVTGHSHDSVRTQSRFSQNTVTVQSEHSSGSVRTQSWFSQNTVTVQSEHSPGSIRTQFQFSQNTVAVQSEHSPGSVRTQSRLSEYSPGSVRTQSRFSQNTVEVQSEHSPVQSEHSRGSVRTQSRFSLNTVPVKSEHSRGSVRTQSRFSQTTVPVQSEHSLGSVRTESRFSQNTVPVQSEQSPGSVRTESRFSQNTVPVQSEHSCGSVRTHSQSTSACVK